jgi:hypothetical protein
MYVFTNAHTRSCVCVCVCVCACACACVCVCSFIAFLVLITHADLALELRDMALSLAALERAMCAFATQQYMEPPSPNLSDQFRPPPRPVRNYFVLDLITNHTSVTYCPDV